MSKFSSTEGEVGAKIRAGKALRSNDRWVHR